MDQNLPATFRYGSVGDAGEWRLVLQAYDADDVETALRMANRLGVGATAGYEGLIRLIEAEALTRQRGERSNVNGWLEIEHIPEETVGGVELGPVALESCEEVACRFGYKPLARTLITILSIEADAPWAVARFGYMTPKNEYSKVCVPHSAAHSSVAFREVVSHEYAHVVVRELTDGKAPRWLNEAVAMLAERSSDLRLRRSFARGSAAWRTPRQLEELHGARRQGEPHPAETWQAYQQSAWIARYLVEHGGEPRIGQLLRGFANNSNWSELKMRVTGQTHADEALREVYGFGEEDLFRRTLDWLRS